MSFLMHSRFLPATAALVTAAAALAACSPPHQQPSTEKVDTVTDAPAPAPRHAEGADAAIGDNASPRYASCLAEPEVRPSTIQADCTDSDAIVEDIEWAEWTNESATGTGTLDGEDVEVEVSQPVEVDVGVLFTVLEIDGEPVAP